MPTIHREREHRYQIYSQDHPPPHIHVKHAGCEAKVFLNPVAVKRSFGFTQQELSRIKDVVRERAREFEDAWIASLASLKDERAVDVRFSDDELIVKLRDGRSIVTPIAWYPRLRSATQAQRDNWVIDGAAWGIHWPDIDEDLSVEGMLDGRPAVGWDSTN